MDERKSCVSSKNVKLMECSVVLSQCEIPDKIFVSTSPHKHHDLSSVCQKQQKSPETVTHSFKTSLMGDQDEATDSQTMRVSKEEGQNFRHVSSISGAGSDASSSEILHKSCDVPEICPREPRRRYIELLLGNTTPSRSEDHLDEHCEEHMSSEIQSESFDRVLPSASRDFEGESLSSQKHSPGTTSPKSQFFRSDRRKRDRNSYEELNCKSGEFSRSEPLAKRPFCTDHRSNELKCSCPPFSKPSQYKGSMELDITHKINVHNVNTSRIAETTSQKEAKTPSPPYAETGCDIVVKQCSIKKGHTIRSATEPITLRNEDPNINSSRLSDILSENYSLPGSVDPQNAQDLKCTTDIANVTEKENFECVNNQRLRRSPRTRSSKSDSPPHQSEVYKKDSSGNWKLNAKSKRNETCSVESNKSGVSVPWCDNGSMPSVSLIVNVGVGFPLTSREALLINSCLDQEFKSLSVRFAEFSASVVKFSTKCSPSKKLLMPVLDENVLKVMERKWKCGAPFVLTTLGKIRERSVPRWTPNSNVSGVRNLFSQTPSLPKHHQDVRIGATILDVKDVKTDEEAQANCSVNTDENIETDVCICSEIRSENNGLESFSGEKRKDIPENHAPPTLSLLKLYDKGVEEIDTLDISSSPRPSDGSINAYEIESSCSERSSRQIHRPIESLKSADKLPRTRSHEGSSSKNNILARDSIRVLGSSVLKRSASLDPDDAARTVFPESENKYPKPSYDPDDTRGHADSNISFNGFSDVLRGKSKLSHELRRLNVALFDVSDHSTNVACRSSETCRLGCVCQSLCGQVMREHCGKVNCMFKCSCSFPAKPSISSSNDTSFAWMQEKAKENLAKEEQQFKLTAVRSGNDSVVLVENKRKREIKLPGRYRDDFLIGEKERDCRGKSQNPVKAVKKVSHQSGIKPTKSPLPALNDHTFVKTASPDVNETLSSSVPPPETPMSIDDLLIKKKQHIASLSSGSIEMLKSRARHRKTLMKRSRIWKKTFGVFRNRVDWDLCSKSRKNESVSKTTVTMQGSRRDSSTSRGTQCRPIQCKVRQCSVLLDADAVHRYIKMHIPAEISFHRNVARKSTAKVNHSHNVLHHSARTFSYAMKVKNQWSVQNCLTRDSGDALIQIKVENEDSTHTEGDNDVLLQISSVQSLPREHWDESMKDCSDDSKSNVESLTFNSYLLNKQENDVVLLPSNILRNEVLSEKVFLWLQIKKLKGKGRIYITDDSTKPYEDCLDVKSIPSDSDEFRDIPFNIKALRPDYADCAIDDTGMWIAKFHKSRWILVGFLQPDESEEEKKLSVEDETNVEENVSVDHDLPAHNKSVYRWWIMGISDVYDHLLFLDYNVLVNRNQLISLLQLSNLRLSKNRIYRIAIRDSSAKSVSSVSYHPDFGIYSLPGLPKHIVIGPYELTQEPKLKVLKKEESHFKRLPLICSGLKQSVMVNWRGVLSSTVDNLPPGCVKGHWLHSLRIHSRAGVIDSDPIMSAAVSHSEPSSSRWHSEFSSQQDHIVEPYSNNMTDPYGDETIMEEGSRMSITGVEERALCDSSGRNRNAVSPYSPTGSEEVKKEYLIPTIEELGYVTVSLFPNNTLSIPHLKKPGLLQFYRSINEVINDVNFLIHSSLAAQSIRCSLIGNSPLKCSCVKWNCVTSLRDHGTISPMKNDIFNGYFILTSKGLFDVREIGTEGIWGMGDDWIDWLSRGTNKIQFNEWQSKVEKKKILEESANLEELLRGHDQGVRLPIQSVVVMATTEIAKLVAQEQLLRLEKRTQKLLRKSLVSSLFSKLHGVSAEDEDLDSSPIDEDGNSEHEIDTVSVSNLLSECIDSIKKKKKKKKPGSPSKHVKSSSPLKRNVSNGSGRLNSLVHSISPFSRLNISVEEGGIVHTTPAVSKCSDKMAAMIKSGNSVLKQSMTLQPYSAITVPSNSVSKPTSKGKKSFKGGKPQAKSSESSLGNLHSSSKQSSAHMQASINSTGNTSETGNLYTCKETVNSSTNSSSILRESSPSPDCVMIDETEFNKPSPVSAVMNKKEVFSRILYDLLATKDDPPQNLHPMEPESSTSISSSVCNDVICTNVVARSSTSIEHSSIAPNKSHRTLSLETHNKMGNSLDLFTPSIEKSMEIPSSSASESLENISDITESVELKESDLNTCLKKKRSIGGTDPVSNSVNIFSSGANIGKGNITFLFQSPTTASKSNDIGSVGEKQKGCVVINPSLQTNCSSVEKRQLKKVVMLSQRGSASSSHSTTSFNSADHTEPTIIDMRSKLRLPVSPLKNSSLSTANQTKQYVPRILIPVSTRNFSVPGSNSPKPQFNVQSPASGRGNIVLTSGLHPVVLPTALSNSKSVEVVCSVPRSISLPKLPSALMSSGSGEKPLYVVSAMNNKTTLSGSNVSSKDLSLSENSRESPVSATKVQYIKMNGLKVPVVYTTLSPKLCEVQTCKATTATTTTTSSSLMFDRKEMRITPRMLASCANVLAKLPTIQTSELGVIKNAPVTTSSNVLLKVSPPASEIGGIINNPRICHSTALAKFLKPSAVGSKTPQTDEELKDTEKDTPQEGTIEVDKNSALSSPKVKAQT